MQLFLKLPALMRSAAALFRSADYIGSVKAVAEILGLLGLTGQASKLLRAVAGIAQADAREIAVAALGVIADIVTAVYGFAPITVQALPATGAVQSLPVAGTVDGESVLARLEYAASAIESVEAQPAALATQPAALDPAIVAVLIELGAELLRRLLDRRLKR